MRALIIFVITIILMMGSLIFLPKIKIGHRAFKTHWMVVLLGALVMLVFSIQDYDLLQRSLFDRESMNPIKLIMIFIFMTIMSLFLDELGFFKYISIQLIQRVKHSQKQLFLLIYGVTSLFTIVTSNDVMILTFTPLVIYFCKQARINPLPYLFGVLVAANTWSMMLLIGNPTNIYLATKAHITFTEYLSLMFLPTVAAGIFGFMMVYFVFRKSLAKPFETKREPSILKDKMLVVIGDFIWLVALS